MHCKDPNTLGDEVMQPLLAARLQQKLIAERSALGRAKFSFWASLTLAVAYGAFLGSRVAGGRNLDSLNLIVVFCLVLGMGHAFKRLKKARESLELAEQLVAAS